MASEKALHMAERAWCTMSTQNINVDLFLKRAFADIIDGLLNEINKITIEKETNIEED